MNTKNLFLYKNEQLILVEENLSYFNVKTDTKNSLDQFSLIHGIRLNDQNEKQNNNNDGIDFAYLLAPNELLESETGSFKSLNNRAHLAEKKLLIKIYPPW